MKMKMMVFICILLCLFLIRSPQQVSNYIHPHEIALKEDKSVTGFKKDGNLVTHLPLIVLKTAGKTIPGAQTKTDQTLQCEYSIYDYSDKMNDSSDLPTQSGHVRLSIRGNSSRLYPKKQYAIKVINEQGKSKKEEWLGMPAHDTWVLNGSYIDHSNIRNYMLYNLSSEIMPYTPRTRLCEVMMTDAYGNKTYQGIYTLIEKPKVDENRVDLETYDTKFAQTAFLLQINSPIDHIEIPHLKPDHVDTLYPSELLYPDNKEVTKASVQYISEHMMKIEKSLYDAYYTGNWNEVHDLIDLDSFVDYYLINEFSQNYDAGRRSTYLYADVDGKLHIGPVWDFDGGLDNFSQKKMDVTWLDLKSTFYYSYLIQNPEFNQRCAKRYFELRQNTLSEERLLEYIDECVDYLGTAAKRNEDVWYPQTKGIFKEDIEQMKEYIVKRGNWMDQYFKQIL